MFHFCIFPMLDTLMMGRKSHVYKTWVILNYVGRRERLLVSSAYLTLLEWYRKVQLGKEPMTISKLTKLLIPY